MKVIYDPGSIKLKKSAIAIGIFDGLHLGHQLLIKSMVAEARRLKVTPVVITFFPHPAHILRPDVALPYLMSFKERLSFLSQLGVKVTLVIRFNKRFAHIDPKTFVENILSKQLGAKSIFVGENFRFGKDRHGDIHLFKKLSKIYGYDMHAIKTLKKKGDVISSGRLRLLIPQGQLKEAESLLGRPVSVVGKVVRGASRGKQLGYPTANVAYENDVLPSLGVYAVRVQWQKKNYYAMANLGVRPSFKENKPKIHLEVHIFDFKKNLYGQEIRVEFLKKIREEKKFPSKDALIAQIGQDERFARNFFKI